MQDKDKLTLPPTVRDALTYCPTLPTLSSVAVQIVELARDPEADPAQLTRIISRDPALASRVLRVSNSSIYARRRSADNLHQAVSVLGFNAAITLALSFSLADCLRISSGAAQLTDYVWRRALAGAVACRQLGHQLGRSDGEELFLAALLQDIGILALHAALPEAYAEIAGDQSGHDTLIERELATFGCDHSQAGAWLMRQWQIPNYVVLATLGSHNPAVVEPDGQYCAAACVAVASRIAEVFVNPEGAGATEDVIVEANRRTGLGQDQLGAVLEGVSNEIPEIAQIFDTEIVSAALAAGIVDQAREVLIARNLDLIREVSTKHRQAEEFERHSQQWQDTAQRDGLTGVSNRWHLDQRLEAEFALAEDNGWPLAVGFLDLDYFKAINDVHGHPVGDQVLIQTANVLQSHVRDGDLVGRYGGEEFVIVLPGALEEHAHHVMERLRAAVEAQVCETDNGATLRVTASVGVTVYNPSTCRHEGPSSLVREADRALYDAKERGRNRVEFFHAS
ncbi:GGDEF domain-containing protein [Aquisalimonas lutea]|uniref:sensor domain-containing diguanylate cyclase n=1 Tax=Aquisalimonas lutea TaxID=1327750 RepID=UPI0025B4DBE3|nr:GGDEF domain-containing protein [Aquisalimonas lutea]MDN3517272.1 GGDEF domain-containing protein [Aquisalimonas lutea]